MLPTEPALPTIVAQFSSLHDVGAYTSAYLIPQCVLQPVCNRLYSVCSFSSVYLSSVLLFIRKDPSIHNARLCTLTFIFSWLDRLCCIRELTSFHLWSSSLGAGGCRFERWRLPDAGFDASGEGTKRVNGRLLSHPGIERGDRAYHRRCHHSIPSWVALALLDQPPHNRSRHAPGGHGNLYRWP